MTTALGINVWEAIPKLRGKGNWNQWKTCLRVHLNALDEEYWLILTRVFRSPRLDLAAEYGYLCGYTAQSRDENWECIAPLDVTFLKCDADCHSTDLEHYEALVTRWDRMNAELLSLLFFVCDEVPLSEIMACDSAVEAYDILEGLYGHQHAF